MFSSHLEYSTEICFTSAAYKLCQFDICWLFSPGVRIAFNSFTATLHPLLRELFKNRTRDILFLRWYTL